MNAWIRSQLISVLRPRLGFYVFGKHPAWPDFVDISRLPALPAPFRIIHERFRLQLEGTYRDPAAVERFICWRHRITSAILLVCPSHDRGDSKLGFRRSPLFLGLSAVCSFKRFAAFAVPELTGIRQRLFDNPLTEAEFLAEIDHSYETLASRFFALLIAKAKEEAPAPQEPEPDGEQETELMDGSSTRIFGANGDLPDWTIRSVQAHAGNRLVDHRVLITMPAPHASWLIRRNISGLEPEELSEYCKKEVIEE